MARSLVLRRLSRSPLPQPVTLQPIGRVHTRVSRPQPYGWEDLESEIRLTVAGAAEMLSGLGGYSHVIVIFWIDRLGEDRPRPARLRPGGSDSPQVGILATRSQLRPNPIGVSVVPLLSVEGARLRVRGLDAIDGTPVLDLKPYIPHYDAVPHARVPNWIMADDGARG